MSIPPRKPHLGEIVLYSHVEGQSWPAMVLEVKQADAPISTPSTEWTLNGEGERVPVASEAVVIEQWVALLQIFRARANEWKWAVEGDEVGTWNFNTQPVVSHLHEQDDILHDIITPDLPDIDDGKRTVLDHG